MNRFLKMSNNYYLNVSIIDNFFIEKDENYEIWHIFAENIKGRNFWNILDSSTTEGDAQEKLKCLILQLNEGVLYNSGDKNE